MLPLYYDTVSAGMFFPHAHMRMRALKGLACSAHATPARLHAAYVPCSRLRLFFSHTFL